MVCMLYPLVYAIGTLLTWPVLCALLWRSSPPHNANNAARVDCAFCTFLAATLWPLLVPVLLLTWLGRRPVAWAVKRIMP